MSSRDYNRVGFRRVKARRDNGFVAAKALQSEGAGAGAGAGDRDICAYNV